MIDAFSFSQTWTGTAIAVSAKLRRPLSTPCDDRTRTFADSAQET